MLTIDVSREEMMFIRNNASIFALRWSLKTSETVLGDVKLLARGDFSCVPEKDCLWWHRFL